jgi:hypothetical protein
MRRPKAAGKIRDRGLKRDSYARYCDAAAVRLGWLWRATRTSFAAGKRSLSPSECTVNTNTRKGSPPESEKTTHADDLVICCRARADEALVAMRSMMSRLKLTLNESKTRVCGLPEEKFDFLGYRFGRCYSPKTGRANWGTTPSKNRVQRLCKAISEMTRRSKTQQDAGTLVEALNRKINGWANWGQPVKPTERWSNTPIGGFFGGCVSNTKSGPGEYAFSPEGPASEVWPGSPYGANCQLSVGDDVNLSPRAGCVNYARRVR